MRIKRKKSKTAEEERKEWIRIEKKRNDNEKPFFNNGMFFVPLNL